MGLPFRFWGTVIAIGVLTPLSFGDVIHELQFSQRSGVVTALAILILGGGGIGALAIRSVRSVHQDLPRSRLAAFASRQWFPMMFLALMAFLALWNSHVVPLEPRYSNAGIDRWTPAVVLPTLMTNAAMIALAIHLLRIGLNEDRGRPFTLGVALFLLWAMSRYVDLFAGVGGMLGAAVMFLLCGLVLFAVARYWQSRKAVSHV